VILKLQGNALQKPLQFGIRTNPSFNSKFERLTGLHARTAGQARIHGGHSVAVPPNFAVPRKFCFKHNKNKNLAPLKMYFPPSNLENMATGLPLATRSLITYPLCRFLSTYEHD